jgi:transposase
MRKRAEWLAHIQHTTRQYTLPEIGKQLAYKANREGVATRFPDPAVQKSLDLDLTLLDADARLRTDLERDRGRTAQEHAAQTCSRLRAIPGIGNILALVRRDEIHALRRFPRGQACVAYGRLVKGATDSAGQRDGTAGTKLGTAYLTGAFAAAAILCRRHHPAGQKDLARLTQKHGQGKALTVLAQK